MKIPSLAPGFQPIRRDQLRQEQEHDSYKRKEKPPEPAVCPGCGAIFHAGRWQWGPSQPDATELLCPACHRIQDDFPAGFLFVNGEFVATHREEMINLLHNHAQKAKATHPLARIMAVTNDDQGGPGMIITTTDIHLVRDLGEALHHAYQGNLEFHYNEAEQLLRVHWDR